MEFTEDEILEVVQRWENTGLLYGLPLYEKQELAPIFDNVARISLYKLDKGLITREVSDLLDNVMYPICRRLYRRVGSDFEVERMMEHLIKQVVENKTQLSKTITEKVNNPIVEFCVNFADVYSDEKIDKNRFTKEEYKERVTKILNILEKVLTDDKMVSLVDKTTGEWVILHSDAVVSESRIRTHNQKAAQEFLRQVLFDTNKGL
jgi:hypothetical protein